MAPDPAHSSSHPVAQPHSRGRLRALSATIAAIVVLALVAAIHVTAIAQYRRSFSAGTPLKTRAAAASLASRLEPWNERLSVRATVMQKWLLGTKLLASGDDRDAMLVLAEAYRLDVGDQELLTLFEKAQDQLTLNSNFKAHVQHGHEGPGGTLRPQDLMP